MVGFFVGLVRGKRERQERGKRERQERGKGEARERQEILAFTLDAGGANPGTAGLALGLGGGASIALRGVKSFVYMGER
jgi:hypothetical protein